MLRIDLVPTRSLVGGRFPSPRAWELRHYSGNAVVMHIRRDKDQLEIVENGIRDGQATYGIGRGLGTMSSPSIPQNYVKNYQGSWMWIPYRTVMTRA